MKTLITKADGSPTKSKIYAVKFLKEKGISEDCLIQENGQFFYEEITSPDLSSEKEEVIKGVAKEPNCCVADSPRNDKACLLPVNWETPVYDKNNEKTVLVIPGTDIKATINAKHPGGQIRPISAFEIAIGQENFIMSLDLVSKLFRVRG